MKFSTILDRLDRHAVDRPEATAYTFLKDSPAGDQTLTFAELRRRSRSIAARLRKSCPRGERAVLLYPPGMDFIPAFLGCLYAGVVPVPAYPPRRNQGSERVLGICVDCEAAVILTVSKVLPVLQSLTESTPQLAELPVICTEDLAAQDPGFPGEIAPGSDDLAFLQYTSGSTGAPKGVMVTHGNIMHNEQLIQRAFGHDDQTVVVGWLPLFHDMGLLGNTLQPLYLGTPCILMSPMAFLQRPLSWLRAISDHRATTSGGPNFAYDLVTAQARKQGVPADLDLSRWSLAYVGAEPVRASTLGDFARMFSSCGFRNRALYPCFGLAEGTLFVTGGMKNKAPVKVRISEKELQQGIAKKRLLPGKGSRVLVGSGREPSGQMVRIVNPETCRVMPVGHVGEIWASGPSIAQGYFRKTQATETVFGACLAGFPDRTWLRTGDLGFCRAEEIYVTGRLKDVIIIRGRNYYPQDIEIVVEACHDGVRQGCAAAFGLDTKGGEELGIVAEIGRHLVPKDGQPGCMPDILDAIRQAVASEFGLQPSRIVLLQAHSILRTSSGKIRRLACRKALEAGALSEVFSA